MTARDRRAELIAAAVSGSLDADEARELAQLTATDPSIEQDVAELRALAARAARMRGWDASPPSAGLRRQVLAIEGASDEQGERHPRRRFRAALLLTAAACLVVGAAVGGVVGAGAARGPTPPDGPPGTLGAVEQVEFTGEPSGSAIDGSVVAHTWGTETVLRIDGLAPEQRYSVVLVGTGGDRFDSGTFLGSDVAIDCRMNAAVLREEVTAVEIADADGDVIAQASLPDAT